MSWAAVFWILYGVGSTLFVVYLFRLGNSVVSNRDDLVRQHVAKMQQAEADNAPETAVTVAPIVFREADSAPSSRLHVERIFQRSDDDVAVQGVRDGATRVVNLPVGMLTAEADMNPRAGRAAREC
jgi:Arc/MetJ-type ribon-helix-helix transcriptional regulator